MTSHMERATETGLLIADRIHKASLIYISEWDPDLHFEIMRVRKRMKVNEKKSP